MKRSTGLFAFPACLMLLTLASKSIDIASLAGHLGVTEEQKPQAHADLTHANVSFAADQLALLMKKSQELGGATTQADQDVVDSIRKMLEEDMKGALWRAKVAGQAMLDAALNAWKGCKATYQAADTERFGVALIQQEQGRMKVPSQLSALFESYRECKQYEQQVGTTLNKCDYYCLNKTENFGISCSENPTCEILSCAVHSSEGYLAYLNRIIGELEGMLDALPKDNCNTHVNTTEEVCCQDVFEQSTQCFKSCGGEIIEIVPGDEISIPKCCAPRMQGEKTECEILDGRRISWTTYDECFETKNQTYGELEGQYRRHEKNWRGQMRAILRMLCLVDTFNKKDQGALIAACVDKDFTSHPQVLNLTLTYGTAFPKISPFVCDPSEIPGTAEWNASKYGGLPEGLGVCPGTSCPTVCDLSLGKNLSRIIEVTTTTTTTLYEEKGTCYKQVAPTVPVVFALNSATAIISVSLKPSPDTKSIKVSLTNSRWDRSQDKLCGAIPTATSGFDVSCTAQGTGLYLVLEGELIGTQVSGVIQAVPSWCHMMTKSGNPTAPYFAMDAEPETGTGVKFNGSIGAA